MPQPRYLLVQKDVTVPPASPDPQSGPEVVLPLTLAPLDPLFIQPVVTTEPISFGPGSPLVYGLMPLIRDPQTGMPVAPALNACVFEQEGQWFCALDSDDPDNTHVVSVTVHEVTD